MATFDDLLGKSKGRTTHQLKKTNKEGARHPFNNQKNHEALIKYVIDRLDFGHTIRTEFCQRLEDIDKAIFGFIKLDDDDRQREKDNRKGEGPKAIKVNVQLTYAQLDEAVTYLLEVFAPDGEMYKTLSTKEKQQIANAFSVLLNQHADKAQHYRELAKFLANAVRYNLGGMQVFWDEKKGILLGNDTDQKLKKEQGVIWAGNVIKSIDMYNVIWDISVHPVDLPDKGEFVAIIDRFTPFRIMKMEKDGEIFDVYKYINVELPAGRTYYRSKPMLRQVDPVSGAGKSINWFDYLSAGSGVDNVGRGVELVNYVGWICPYDFGLSDSKDLEIWRLVIAQGQFLTSAKPITNSHSMLPFSFASPNEDDIGLQQKSFGELLMPFQAFGSHLVNTHIEGSRKSLYGLTIYDPQVVALNELPATASGRVPTKQTGMGVDLQKSVMHINEGPDTKETMNDFAKVLDIMQKILPTQMMQQVADLQRATQYQAAATVQAGNKRNHKIAKLIDDQALKNMRFMQMYNVFEKQEQIEILGPDGTLVKINPSQFRDAKLEFAISDGLKAVDKLTMIAFLKDLFNMLIQSPTAGQQVDILGMLNYLSSLMGDKYDLRQFKIQGPTPEQKLAQAQANEANANAMGTVAGALQQAPGTPTVQ